MQSGAFVSFEGSEGCGKSTQIRHLQQRLRERQVPFLITREPGGTPVGESIRHLLKFAPEGHGMCAETEVLLFAASRAQLVRDVIQPALAEGTLVIADRFLDSTTVYQGIARGLDREAVRQINALATGPCLPALTLVLDMDAEKAWHRARKASGRDDRMEKEEFAFYETVRRGYLELARTEPRRFAVIDADRDEDLVSQEIWNKVSPLIDGLSC
jgi:dTMP kinase